MSLASMNGESVWLGKKNLCEEKSYSSLHMSVVEKRKSLFRRGRILSVENFCVYVYSLKKGITVLMFSHSDFFPH